MAKALNVSVSVNADTSQAKAALQDLQNSLTQLRSGGNLSLGNLGLNATEIQQASKAVIELQSHLHAATNVNTGTLNFAKLSTSLKAAKVDIADYGAQLLKLGPQGQQAFQQLTTSIANSEIPMRKLSTLMGNFGTVLKNTIRWQLSSSMIHGFIGGIQSAFNYAQNLNQSLNNIQIVTGKSNEEMALFAESANKAAKELSTTTTRYTDASLIYYQQGIRDQKEIDARTRATIKMANVTGQSAETVSNQMTAIWNNFAKGSTNLEYYADVITALGAATASSSAEISTGLSKFAAIADTVGLSYENATAALATITATTRQSADSVGTGLRTLFARLQSLSLGETLEDGVNLTKYSTALKKVGVEALDAQGNLRSMDDVLNDLGKRWNALSDAQKTALAQTVGGIRQYTTLMALMNNFDFYQENLNVAQNSKGTLQKQQEIYEQSWKAANDRVRASAESIYSSLLNDQFFIKMNNNFAGFLDVINNLIKGLGGMKSILLTIGSVASMVFKDSIVNKMAAIPGYFKELFTPAEVWKQQKRSALDQLVSVAASPNTAANITADQQSFLKAQTEAQVWYAANKNNISPYDAFRHQLLGESINRDVQEFNQMVAKQSNLRDQRSDLRSSLFGQAFDNIRNSAAYQDRAAAEKLITQYGSNKGGLPGSYRSMSQQDRQIYDSLISKGILDRTGKISSSFSDWQTTDAGFMSKFTQDFDKGIGDMVLKSNWFKNSNTENLFARTYASGSQARIDAADKILANHGVDQSVIDAYKSGNIKFSDLGEQQLQKTIGQISSDYHIDRSAVEQYVNMLREELKTTESIAEARENVKKKLQEQEAIQREAEQINKTEKQISSTASAFLSLGMAISQTTGVMNQWEQVLKTGEGTGQALLTTLTMLPMAFTMLSSSLKSMGTAFGGGFAKILSGGKLAIITAAIIGLIALIAGISKAIKANSTEAKLEKLQENAEQAKSQAESAKSAYDNLLSSKATHNDLLDTLKTLKEGTIEFRDALLEANAAADAIIQGNGLKYGKDWYFNEQGAKVFTEGTLDRITEQSMTYAEQMAQASAYADFLASAKDLVSEEMKEDFAGITEYLQQYPDKTFEDYYKANHELAIALENGAEIQSLSLQQREQLALGQNTTDVERKGKELRNYAASLGYNSVDELVRELAGLTSAKQSDTLAGLLSSFANEDNKVTFAEELAQQDILKRFVTQDDIMKFKYDIASDLSTKYDGHWDTAYKEIFKTDYIPENLQGKDNESALRAAVENYYGSQQLREQFSTALMEYDTEAVRALDNYQEQTIPEIKQNASKLREEAITARAEEQAAREEAAKIEIKGNATARVEAKAAQVDATARAEAAARRAAAYESAYNYTDSLIQAQVDGLNLAFANVATDADIYGDNKDNWAEGLANLLVSSAFTDLDGIKTTVNSYANQLGSETGHIIASEILKGAQNESSEFYDFIKGVDIGSTNLETFANIKKAGRRRGYDTKELLASLIEGREGSLFEELYNSEEFAESLKSLQEEFQKTGKIGADSILSIADQSDALKELLEDTEVNAQGVADVLAGIEMGEIDADSISSGLLKAMSAAGELNNNLAKALKLIKEFEEDPDAREIGEFASKGAKTIKESIDSGAYFNPVALQYMRLMFGEEKTSEYVADIERWLNEDGMTAEKMKKRIQKHHGDMMDVLNGTIKYEDLGDLLAWWSENSDLSKYVKKDKDGNIDFKDNFEKDFKTQEDFIKYLTDTCHMDEQMALLLANDIEYRTGIHKLWQKGSVLKGLSFLGSSGTGAEGANGESTTLNDRDLRKYYNDNKDILKSLTSQEIADAFGLSVSQVDAALKRHGKEGKAVLDSWRDLAEIFELTGHSVVEMGKDFDYSSTNIEKFKEAYGKSQGGKTKEDWNKSYQKLLESFTNEDGSLNITKAQKALQKLGYTAAEAKDMVAAIADDKNSNFDKFTQDIITADGKLKTLDSDNEKFQQSMQEKYGTNWESLWTEQDFTEWASNFEAHEKELAQYTALVESFQKVFQGENGEGLKLTLVINDEEGNQLKLLSDTLAEFTTADGKTIKINFDNDTVKGAEDLNDMFQTIKTFLEDKDLEGKLAELGTEISDGLELTYTVKMLNPEYKEGESGEDVPQFLNLGEEVSGGTIVYSLTWAGNKSPEDFNGDGSGSETKPIRRYFTWELCVPNNEQGEAGTEEGEEQGEEGTEANPVKRFYTWTAISTSDGSGQEKLPEPPENPEIIYEVGINPSPDYENLPGNGDNRGLTYTVTFTDGKGHTYTFDASGNPKLVDDTVNEITEGDGNFETDLGSPEEDANIKRATAQDALKQAAQVKEQAEAEALAQAAEQAAIAQAEREAALAAYNENHPLFQEGTYELKEKSLLEGGEGYKVTDVTSPYKYTINEEGLTADAGGIAPVEFDTTSINLATAKALMKSKPKKYTTDETSMLASNLGFEDVTSMLTAFKDSDIFKNLSGKDAKDAEKFQSAFNEWMNGLPPVTLEPELEPVNADDVEVEGVVELPTKPEKADIKGTKGTISSGEKEGTGAITTQISQNVQDQLGLEVGSEVQLEVEVDGQTGPVMGKIESINGEEVTISVAGDTGSAEGAIAALDGQTISINVVANVSGMPESSGAMGFNNARLPGYAGGRHYGSDFQGIAETGELGPELWVHNGQPALTGVHGRNKIFISEGDQIFTAAQTREILRNNPSLQDIPGFDDGTPTGYLRDSEKKGGGGGGGKGGKDFDPERYHVISRQLADLERLYDRLSKIKEKAYGTNILDSIQQEINMTNKLIQAQQTLINEIEEYRQEDLQKLKDLGIDFQLDEMGNIAKWDELQDLYAEKAQNGDEGAKKNWEAIQKYEETIDKMHEAEEQMKDYINQLSDLALEKIKTEVELVVNMDDREIKYIDHFINKLDDEIYDVAEALGLVEQKMGKIQDKIDTSKAGLKSIFDQMRNQYGEELKESEKLSIEKILEMGKTMTGKEIFHALDPLHINGDFGKAIEELTDNLLQYVEELEKLKTEGVDRLDKAFDKLNDNISKSMDLFEYYNEILTSMKNITELQGVTISKQMRELGKELNKSILFNTLNELQAERANYAYLEDAVKDLQNKVNNTTDKNLKLKWQEELDKAEEKLRDSNKNILSLIENGLEQVRTMFENTLDGIVEDYGTAISGIYGTTDELSNAFDRKKEIDDFYVDDYEKYYQIAKLQRSITSDLDKAARAGNKSNKGLKQLYDELNTARQDGVELTEYDLDVFSKRYEYEKALMELEDARNNKSEVRLQRDANGNWGYVYTSAADEDDLLAKQQAVDDKLYEWQKTVDSKADEVQKTILEGFTNIIATAGDMLKNGASKEAVDDFIKDSLTKLDLYSQQFGTSLSDAFKTLDIAKNRYNEDAFDILDSYQESVLASIMNMDLDSIYDLINGSINDAYVALDEYIADVDKIDTAGGYDDLINDILAQQQLIDRASAQTTEETLSMINESSKTFDDLMEKAIEFENTFLDTYSGILAQTEEEISYLLNVLDALNRYKDDLDDGDEYDTRPVEPEITNPDTSTTPTGGTGGGGGSGGGSNGCKFCTGQCGQTVCKNTCTGGCDKHCSNACDDTCKDTCANTCKDECGVGCTSSCKGICGNQCSGTCATGCTHGCQNTCKGTVTITITATTVKTKKKATKMASGGYTGEWGAEGRWAILHEKEQVFNKEDTAKLLDAAKILRTIDIQSDIFSKGLSGISIPQLLSQAQELEQNVHIDASFPNVTDHNEIEMAFDNLINKASQYANRKNMSSMTFQDMYTSKF